MRQKTKGYGFKVISYHLVIKNISKNNYFIASFILKKESKFQGKSFI